MLKVDSSRLDDWTLEELEEELEDTDCLPKDFWTNSEWYGIQKEKRAITNEIKKVLREEMLYYDSLQIKGQEEC